MERWQHALVLLIALLFSGCAGSDSSLGGFMDAPFWWRSAQADAIRERARDLEEKGELTQALTHWRIAAQIPMGGADAAANAEIARIEKAIADAVSDHYRKGIASLQEKKVAAAKRHFLAALRLDPTFEPALQQIKSTFSPFPLTIYRSHDDESLADVAESVYGNRDKAFLVAWFNDLPEAITPPSGTLLILPKSDALPVPESAPKPLSLPAPDILAGARDRLAEGDLDGALVLVQQAGADTPDAQALIHAIWLAKARLAIEADALDTAESLLAAVPDDTPDKAAVMDALQKVRDRLEANRELERVRRHLQNGRFAEALDRSERLLTSQPDNTEARKLAIEARYRLAAENVEQKHYLAARKILASADKTHAASMALKARVEKQLQKEAQNHYRQGVKHFINENLEAAMQEWEQALVCDPDHRKARENIDNARRLLEKIETIQ